MRRAKLACIDIYEDSSGDYFCHKLTFHGQVPRAGLAHLDSLLSPTDLMLAFVRGACLHACMHEYCGIFFEPRMCTKSQTPASITCSLSSPHSRHLLTSSCPPQTLFVFSSYTGRRLNPSPAHHLANLPSNPARPHRSHPGSPVRLPRHLQSSGLPNWPLLHLPVPRSPLLRHLPAPQSPRPALRLLRPSSSPIPPSSALPRSRCVTYYRLADDQTTSLLCATLVHYPR